MGTEYDRPTRPCKPGPASGGAQPGAAALLAALLARWSSAGAYSSGIYNCRDVRGGSTPSVHSEGRAIDLGIRDKAVGDRIAAQLLAAAPSIGLQQIIWNRRSIRPGSTWRSYNGVNPHTDHLHIELNWHGARTLTPQAADAALDGAGTPLPPEDDPSTWEKAQAGAKVVVGQVPFIGPAFTAVDKSGNVIAAIDDAADVLAVAVGFLTDPETWLRTLAVILGSGLILVGLTITARDLGMRIPTPPLGPVASVAKSAAAKPKPDPPPPPKLAAT